MQRQQAHSEGRFLTPDISLIITVVLLTGRPGPAHEQETGHFSMTGIINDAEGTLEYGYTLLNPTDQINTFTCDVNIG